MKDIDPATVYIGAAMHRDLESEEVDVILAAVGLAADKNPVTVCTAAIKNYTNQHTNWTPAGPITNMEPARAAVKQ